MTSRKCRVIMVHTQPYWITAPLGYWINDARVVPVQ